MGKFVEYLNGGEGGNAGKIVFSLFNLALALVAALLLSRY
jgi:hypothetical protein